MSQTEMARRARAIFQARLRASREVDGAFKDRAKAAERLGIHRDTLGRYERGVFDVPHPVLIRMVREYRMSDKDALALLKDERELALPKRRA